ncbi:formate--tetrahydrofolate ligase-domain-containing protein [Chiua virens]|nr:formate--tetrahydrofolate ligase-domain-containing protein [Chiua virens]
MSSSQARVIDGTLIAKSIRQSVTDRVAALKLQFPRFQPHLAVVQAGDRPDSTVYIRMKAKASEEVGIHFQHVTLPEAASVQEVVSVVKRLNDDDSVNGILVQLPLGPQIDADGVRTVTESISPEKDVDGFHAYNIGHLSSRASSPLFTPCTPAAVIRLLESTGVTISGANAVVLGRSDIVGNPVVALLRNKDATVTQCHSRTKNLEQFVRQADILVAAIGQAEFVKGSWIKPGAVVIDVGINSIPDATKKSGQRLVGDVEYDQAALYASHITPVPGGVGPMTVALLMENVLTAGVRQFEEARARKLVPLPLDIKTQVPSDIEIAMAHTPKPVTQLAREIASHLHLLVRANQPQPLVLHKLWVHTLVDLLLLASVSPVKDLPFGIKGGAAGGGYSQVIPMDEFNLHLTGDIHAVTAANNLLAAALDAPDSYPPRKGKREFAPLMFKRLQKLGINKTNPNDLTPEEINRFARLDIDPETITWNRVLDTNDRFLRKVTLGRNPTEQGHEREAGFDIAVASECMAVLALTTDLNDMRERLGAMVVATSKRGEAVTADDIGVGGALAVLMKDTVKPNLMQTLEGTPVFVHAGPFANIAHGNSSILADRVALKLAGTEPGDSSDRVGYVLTEGGFGADMGMEKFCNIKCRFSGLKPDATVTPGKPLADTYTKEDLVTLQKGCENLARHIQNAGKFGLKVIIAINRFSSDTDAELQLIRREALAAGADAAVVSNHWAEGGTGARALAEAVVVACEGESNFKFLYDLDLPIDEKIDIICKEVYRADGIELSELARKQLDTYTRQGYRNLPICMAKTQYSFSHNPSLKNAPTGFIVPIREVRLSAGAGFLYPILGDMQTMPGLGTRPGFWEVGLDPETGRVVGLF